MFNFVLPNGRNINTDDLIDALGGSDGMQAFLDERTGQVEWLLDPDNILGDDDEESAALRKQIDNQASKRYFLIEPVPSSQQYKWMESFAEDIVRGDDNDLTEKLNIALDGEGAFGRFKRTLGAAGEEWLAAWYSYRDDSLWEEMLRWLESLPFQVRQQMDYADNCEVCQTMKKAENEGRQLSETELVKAFDKANHPHLILNPKLWGKNQG